MNGVRSRGAVALLGLVMLAGCAASTTTAAPATTAAVASADASSTPPESAASSPSPQTTPSTTASPSAGGSDTPTCGASDVSIGFGPRLSPATQEDGDILAVRNVGSQACRIRGYLNIHLRLSGSSSSPSVPDRGGMYVTSASPSWVTIAPQHDAYVVVAKSHCQFSGGWVVQALDISLPGSPTVSTLKLVTSSFGALTYCPDQPGQGSSSSSSLQMSPISASVAAAEGA